MAGEKKKSTTRSVTNLESLDQHTFFLDRALEGYALRDALTKIGARVQMHRDHFDAEAEDKDWLPAVAKLGRVILSTDQFNWLEREAIRNAGGRAFLLMHGNMTGDEQVAIIVGAMPRMLRILKSTPAPFIAKIYGAKRVLILSSEFRPHSPISR
jgi:hypothetical protein